MIFLALLWIALIVLLVVIVVDLFEETRIDFLGSDLEPEPENHDEEFAAMSLGYGTTRRRNVERR